MIDYCMCRYKWLDNTLPGTTGKIILKKLVLDQFLLTPTLLVLFFTGSENLKFRLGTKSNIYLYMFNFFRNVRYGKSNGSTGRVQTEIFTNICSILFVLVAGTIVKFPFYSAKISGHLCWYLFIYLG